MRTRIASAVLAIGCCALGNATAQETFQPERVTVEPLAAGPHLYAASGNRVHIIDPKTLKYQTQITFSPAYGNKLIVSEDGARVYVASTFFSRPWTGTGVGKGVREDVLVAYDTKSMEPTFEVPIIPKNAPTVGIAKEYAGLSVDGRWIFIQNATPASSVTVVDTKARKQTAEIPAPGCWGVYPSATNALRFSALCGDGKMVTYTLAADGRKATSTVSDKLFDAATDPLFMNAQQDGDTLIFMSFNGNVYEIALGEQAARLAKKFSITDKVQKKWAPGGSQMLAYLPQGRVLYALMHDKPFNGSQVEPGKEIWAIDMNSQTVISRSTIKPTRSITAVAGEMPLLYASGTGELVRYEINKSAAYTVREDEVMKLGDGAAYLEVK